MVKKSNLSRKIFVICNTVFLVSFGLLCLFPYVHIFALSLSSSTASSTGQVFLWPVEFNLTSYEHIIKKPDFMTSFWVSIKRVALGLVVQMIVTVLAAYPLSKDKATFRARSVFVWFFVITMFFSGGLIPTFLIVSSVGLIDSLWALVLPGALSVYNMTLLLNFFRNLPKEMEESAFIDGAGHFTILTRIILPTSLPVLATVALFITVGHWNAWFDGMIYMSKPQNQPMQTYMKNIVITPDVTKMLGSFSSSEIVELLKRISERTLKSAQIFVGALPIMVIYPFLQRFFIKGIVIGSVKG